MRLVFLTLVLACAAARGAVLITHFNTFPLLDSDNATPLQGTSASGDLIQVIDTGLDGLPDLPDVYGFPSGDDLFLGVLSGSALTHVGDNEPVPNWNQGLYNDTVLVSDGSVGLNIFLRFWNGPSPSTATYYGESMALAIPPAPLLGPAFLDFVPVAGSPRTTDIPFTALAYSSVPEPATALVLGLALLVLRTGRRLNIQARRVRRAAGLLPLALAAGLAVPREASAQLTPPLDVTASRPILGPDGAVLAGTSPDSATYAYTAISGALVQILAIGPNGAADLPASDGGPAGDDLLVAEVKIGQGVAPNLGSSGTFSATVFSVPAPGARLYARAFNAATRAEATHWGQSAVFTFQPLQVMDVSQLGLLAATLPLGVDLATVDSDGDGQTDLEEFRANTSATSAADLFRLIEAGSQPWVKAQGKAGRRYRLERAVGELSGAPSWETVLTTPPLTESAELRLADPQPPAAGAVVYRLRVLEP